MDWVHELRLQTPVCKKCTYLDCAYDCGGTTFAASAAQQYFEDWCKSAALVERGGPGRKSFFDKADKTRTLICNLIGARDPKEVCFTRNTNEGISHILMGFDDFKPGDNIITADIEHPSVLMPCLNAEKLKGVECRIIKAEKGEYLPSELYINACDSHTRMIVLSHVQSSNGYKTDLKAIGDYCRKMGIYLIVDAIQSLGFSVFEAETWGASAVSAGGYKGLLAGESAAFLWCSKALLEHIWPTYTAAGAAMTVDKSKKKWELNCSDASWARKLENSSLDAPGIYVLYSGISTVLKIEPKNIEKHIRTLYETLYDGLVSMGIQPITPRDKASSCASIAFDMPSKEDFFVFMRSNGVAMTCSRLLRMSIGAFNTADDIQNALSNIRSYLKVR